jgi:Uri superfamily endonuclease
MKSEPGTYAIIFRCRTKTRMQIGRFGNTTLRKGYYIYVGSAFGPGGVHARVSRHYRKNKTPHWHIDYLRAFMSPVSVWYTHDHRRLEHRWAHAFLRMDRMIDFKGFGCSDCGCRSHLFYTRDEPEPAVIAETVGGQIGVEPFTGRSAR